jgi:hypothetical protein
MAKATKPKAPKCPKGCTLGDYNGKPTIVYGDEDRAPSHGQAKAVAVCMMADAKMTPEDISVVCGKLGAWNMKKVNPALLIAGCRFLVAHCEAQKEAKKAAA